MHPEDADAVAAAGAAAAVGDIVAGAVAAVDVDVEYCVLNIVVVAGFEICLTLNSFSSNCSALLQESPKNSSKNFQRIVGGKTFKRKW